MTEKITTANPHYYRVGDKIVIEGLYLPWWKKLFYWLFSIKNRQEYTVVNVSENTITYE